MDENQQQNRVQLAEDFVLNPEKVLFQLVSDFQETIGSLQSQFEGVDPAALETLKGADGYNPERGVDYMTDADLEALEQFIIERLPVLGQDIATREQTEAMVKKYVGKIPSIKGDKGKPGVNGKDGKDGSPDTPAQVYEKIKGKLKIADVKNLKPQLDRIGSLRTEMEELRKEVETNVIVNHKAGGGGISTPTVDTVLTDEQVQDIIGAIIQGDGVVDATYNDAGNQIDLTFNDPNCFTSTQAGHGFAVGDILYRTAAGDVLSDAVNSASADTHKIVKEVTDANTYIWSANAQYITQNVPAYPDGTNIYLAVGGGLTDTPPTTPGSVVNNVGYVEQSGALMVLHASTIGFVNPEIEICPIVQEDGSSILLENGDVLLAESCVGVTSSNIVQEDGSSILLENNDTLVQE